MITENNKSIIEKELIPKPNKSIVIFDDDLELGDKVPEMKFIIKCNKGE